MGKAGIKPKMVCCIKNCPNRVYARKFCKKHYDVELTKNPEVRNLKNSHISKINKNRRLEVINALGGKCESCGELLNLELQRVNLEIHHKYYDDKDKELLEKYRGSTGPTQHLGYRPVTKIKKMIKNGIDPHQKFGLLCKQCNLLEGWIQKNPEKARRAIEWCKKSNIL